MKIDAETEKLSKLYYYAVIIAFLILLMRLWQLQILQGRDYRNLSEANRLKIIAIPAPRGIIFDRNGIPLVKNYPYFFASIIPIEFNNKYIESLSKILNIPIDEIQKKINNNGLNPLTNIRLKQGLSFPEVAYIEARRSEVPGLIIEVEMSREYIYNEIGSHLIGYLGKLSPAQSKDSAFNDVPRDAFIGQWGIEKSFDKTLRGIPGKKVIEVDALGRDIKTLQGTAPVKGKDMMLSIDINLQNEAEKALGERTGAVVAMDPQNGEILSMISKPSFDSNLFTKGIKYEDWMSLVQNKKNPFLNRALQSQYPPGSTFKIVTAIAGLEEGVIIPDTKVNCTGSISYGNWNFGCWRKKGHGIISLHRALVESCDIFFYEVGKRLGIDKIYEYATHLGLGKETGIDIVGERKGLVPNSKWKLENKKLPWFLGETFNTAIGQGYVTVTPLQMAVLTSTVVNGGYIYKPSLTKNAQPEILGKLTVRPETLDIVKKALYGVVNEPNGTGWAAKSNLTNIGGKTGTAQVVAQKMPTQYIHEKFRDHAWFIAFAPVEKPDIAVAVFVEHGGHGGGAAAPIAKNVIEEYIKEKNEKAMNNAFQPKY